MVGTEGSPDPGEGEWAESGDTCEEAEARPGVGAGQGPAWLRSCWQPLHSSSPHRKPWWVPHYLAELLGKQGLTQACYGESMQSHRHGT